MIIHPRATADWNNDDADDAETAGYSFAFTRSLAGTRTKGERLLGTHQHPERQSQNIQGSLGEELDLADVASGSFGLIREIAVLSGRSAMIDE
jgi:hypothetical protein